MLQRSLATHGHAFPEQWKPPCTSPDDVRETSFSVEFAQRGGAEELDMSTIPEWCNM